MSKFDKDISCNLHKYAFCIIILLAILLEQQPRRHLYVKSILILTQK